MNEKNNIEEKILSEERVYEGKIVKVSILDVTLPNGGLITYRLISVSRTRQ